MMRVSGFLIGLLILPAVVRAQTAGSGSSPFTRFSSGTIPVELLRLDGDPYNDDQNKPVSGDECDRDAEIVFRLTLAGMTAGSSYMQLWVGNDCQNPDNRDQVGETDCDRMPVDDTWQISTAIQEFATTVGPLCDKTDGTLNLFFLPASNTTEPEGVVQAYGRYELEIDKDAPAAPSNVRAGTGENEIPIEWTVNTPADVFTNYLVWDKNPVGGLSLDGDGGASVEGECTSEILKQGEDVNLDELADNRNIGIDEVPGKVEKTTVSGDSLGARRVAMAVVAADLAGNISQISNVDCLQVVATNGFWDTYKANGGEAETGCACSTPGTRTSLGSGLVPIALVVVAWGMRRRARKRSGS